MNVIDWNRLERDEINLILEFMDEDTDSYIKFLMWKQVKEEVKKAEQEFMRKQKEDYDRSEEY